MADLQLQFTAVHIRLSSIHAFWLSEEAVKYRDSRKSDASHVEGGGGRRQGQPFLRSCPRRACSTAQTLWMALFHRDKLAVLLYHPHQRKQPLFMLRHGLDVAWETAMSTKRSILHTLGAKKAAEGTIPARIMYLRFACQAGTGLMRVPFNDRIIGAHQLLETCKEPFHCGVGSTIPIGDMMMFCASVLYHDRGCLHNSGGVMHPRSYTCYILQ
jgi:hypothetical protein